MNVLSQTPSGTGLQQLSGGPTAATGRIREVADVEAGAEQGRDPVGPTEQEQQLVRTRKAANRLAVALVRNPFAPETAEAVREFLSGAGAAGDAFAALQRQPEDQVRARIAELTAARRKEEACS